MINPHLILVGLFAVLIVAASFAAWQVRRLNKREEVCADDCDYYIVNSHVPSPKP